MTCESTSACDHINLSFAIVVAWIGTLLALGYHGVWVNNLHYQGFSGELPQALSWYATVAPATLLLPLALTVFAVILARRDASERGVVSIRLVVNSGWAIGVLLPIAVIVLWQLPFMLIGTSL